MRFMSVIKVKALFKAFAYCLERLDAGILFVVALDYRPRGKLS